MARRWTIEEEQAKYKELASLYIDQNKTLQEIADILRISPSTVYDRMVRLGISATPQKKKTYAAQRRNDITLPKNYSPELAEFFGIMLGDGKLSYYQVMVTLGNKEMAYVEYVCDKMEKLFCVRPKVAVRNTGYRVVYLGSRDVSNWLQSEGLVYNKVLSQVNAPQWIFMKKEFMKKFLKGFFDTDGSIYKLRYGLQLSFTNASMPLLKSLRGILKELGYTVSNISTIRCYVTKHDEIVRFFKEIQPANPKHQARFASYIQDLGR
ncbi:MAG: LAGLIDADG family homing endonuclease [Patescibacteria group bacterium]